MVQRIRVVRNEHDGQFARLPAVVPRQENLGLLGKRTQRLNRLLDDLLAYSRAGRYAYPAQAFEQLRNLWRTPARSPRGPYRTCSVL